jgi:hypothetical protein
VYDAAVRPRAVVLGWGALALLVVAVTAPALGDPPFWDANVYVHQGRYAAAHGLDWNAWRHPPDVLKPPLFASVVLGLLSAGDRGPWLSHVAVLAFALGLLAGTRALTRALGGSETTALVAGALSATAPLLVAQAGLVQSDLPMATLALWAWVALLRQRTALWLVLSAAAVLTKESAYFLCAPALVLVWLRPGGSPRATLKQILVPAWPGLVLVGWLLLLRALTGTAVPRLNRDALGANFLVDTLVHQLVEGGRLLLVPLAILALGRDRSPARWATGAGVLALPLMFPAPLPRYMLTGLPWMAALAALGLAELVPRRRALALGLVVATQIVGWFGPSWHANGGHHLDCNLRYRRLLAAQRQAVRAVAAERPRAVVAAFPLYFALSDPPAEGWLPAPVPVVLADASTPTAALCAADFFVDADQTAPVDGPRARLGPALTPWRSFGPPGLSVRVARIACADAPTRTPPAPPSSKD